MALRIESASFTASTHCEVFPFYTRSTSVCCNHSCKNLSFVITQKLCCIQHVVTIFTVCSKAVSNLFAIHWKRPFKRPNVFSTTNRLLLSVRLKRSEESVMSQFSKEYVESPSIKELNSSQFVLACLLEENSFSDILCIRVSS